MNSSDCKGQDFVYLPYRSGPQGFPGSTLAFWLTKTPLELWSNVLIESEWWREGWSAGFFPVMAYSFVCYPITSLNLFALDLQWRYAIRWCLNLRSLLPVSLMKEILEELSCHIYSWWLSITPLIGQTRARMTENTSPGLVWRCFCAPFSILAVTFDPSVNTMQITSIWKARFGANEFLLVLDNIFNLLNNHNIHFFDKIINPSYLSPVCGLSEFYILFWDLHQCLRFSQTCIVKAASLFLTNFCPSAVYMSVVISVRPNHDHWWSSIFGYGIQSSLQMHFCWVSLGLWPSFLKFYRIGSLNSAEPQHPHFGGKFALLRLCTIICFIM